MKNSYRTLCHLFEGSRRQQLIAHLADRYRWSQPRADRTVDEYLMFLSVVSSYPDTHLVPTADIDCVWEADILQSTAQYVETCQQLCGQIIHHAGTAELEALSTFDGIEAAFARTNELLTQHFGIAVRAERLAAACGVL